MSFDWGYTETNGPATWSQHFEAARGNRQTPIDIVTSQAKYDPSLKPVEVRYVPTESTQLKNTSKSFQVVIEGNGSSLKGGPLKSEYQAAQLHMHWGSTSATGSEHTVDGKQYAAEIHIVHANKKKLQELKDVGAVMQDPEGLCVLGMFVKAGAENASLKKLIGLLDKIQYSGDSVKIPGGFDPAGLLPVDKDKYWTYLGSLTTPPCYESVTWVVYKEPIEMSEQQLAQFRKLLSTKAGEAEAPIVDNFRPPKGIELGNRELRASFK